MLNDLPIHLRDRARLVNQHQNLSAEGPVIVWLKSSLRVHENPAIDAGRIIAFNNNRQLLIYQAIDERYPHANLRHHNMLLDGARDLHKGCTAQGLNYVLHVARENNRQAVMKHFAKIAGCIITDLFPLPPWKNWVKSIAESAECPMVEIDCHCVIPMTIFGKSVDRPFKFRDATKKLRKRLIQQSWPTVEKVPARFAGELPFTPIDIDRLTTNPEERILLLKNCAIDPSVYPIWQENGGEISSLARWQEFLDKNLSGYARRRNNAADPYGVSRLSAAFHYGFISPMKVAREAAAIGTKSADKYLDELLIFREHAWHHVAASENPYCSSNLPHWALESWNNTADDPRPVLLDEHQIEYARSPNHLWNLCQESLIRHGELHNNLRMTWGKAVPQWSSSLEQSLIRAQKYNDKYALDGRDPSSIAGVQWCHGLFDRAFFPSLPVMGVVRKRDLETHASRLDLETYAKHIKRNTTQTGATFVVLGSGIVECYIARVLFDNGINVYYLPTQSSDDKTELTDEQLAPLPDYLQGRITSISEKIGSRNLSRLGKNLVRGITIIEPSDLKIKSRGNESELHLEANKSSISLTGAIFLNAAQAEEIKTTTGINLLDFNHCSIQETIDCESEVSLLPTALWQAIEFIWPFCLSQTKATYSLQTKLI